MNLTNETCYRNVKDTSAKKAMFKIVDDEKSTFLFTEREGNIFCYGQLHLGPYHLILHL